MARVTRPAGAVRAEIEKYLAQDPKMSAADIATAMGYRSSSHVAKILAEIRGPRRRDARRHRDRAAGQAAAAAVATTRERPAQPAPTPSRDETPRPQRQLDAILSAFGGSMNGEQLDRLLMLKPGLHNHGHPVATDRHGQIYEVRLP